MFLIEILNFKERILNDIKDILNVIDCSIAQKELIWKESIEILKNFVSRIEKKELMIHYNTQSRTIAATIIYSTIVSDEEPIDIGYRSLSIIANVNKDIIAENYNKYFKDFYPRTKFLFTGHSFKNIINKFSLIIFRFLIKNNQLTTAEIFSELKKNVIENENLEQLEKKDIDILKDMVFNYQDIFSKFFSDLIDIVKLITYSSRNHKLINATILIFPLVEYLEDKGINLLQKTPTFYKYIRDIFDFLSEIYNDFFPNRRRAFEEKMSKSEYQRYKNTYRQIIGYRLKIYLLKNMYKGRFFKNGTCRCPECEKEGFIINTDISRLNALEFHHESEKKEETFSAVRLYEIFAKNQTNPDFLENMIRLIESEKVTLLCRNHHMMKNDYYYNYFKDFISLDNLFSFSAEEIHLFIRIIVDNFRLTMNLTKERKKLIRQRIRNRIKKRYVIEQLYGDKCHICGEFNTKTHIRTFDFSHQDPSNKEYRASTLFDTYPCSKIVEILKEEGGAYICSNCHTVFDMEYFNIIDDVYDDKEIAIKTKNDYNWVKKWFTPISNTLGYNIKDPLTKEFKSGRFNSKYLIAIYELSKQKKEITNNALSEYLGLDYSAVKSFFLRYKQFLKKYVDFSFGKPTKYTLNSRGEQLVSLINSIKTYYSLLKFDECEYCKLNIEEKCLVKQPDQCPIIKNNTFLQDIL